MNIKGHPALLSLFAARLPGIYKKDGAYWAKCIFHPDKNPSLNINKDGGDYVFHCFGCGEGGDVIKFLQKTDNLSFNEAKKLIEQATGGDWEETKKLADATFKTIEIAEMTKEYKRFPLSDYAKFEIALYESKDAQEWLFKERGITYDTARKLHFGYTPNLGYINKSPDPRFESIAGKGWVITPAVEKEEVVCIECRSMSQKAFSRKKGMEPVGLYGVDFISWNDPVYVVEGKFDQAVLIQAGFRAVSLANAETNLTPKERDLLMSASVVILAGDNDGKSGTAKMIKLWQELQERTYRLVWPNGKKDANQTFLESCSRNIDEFKTLIESLTLQAYSNPLPGIRSIQEILKHNDEESSENRQDKFEFSVPAMDKMANVTPGCLVYISAASTGTGKTQLTVQETLRSARKHKDIVLNYQTQLQGEEIGDIVTANLLAKDRNEITSEDRVDAAKRLRGVQYYIGNNPHLTTSSDVLDLIEAGIRRVGANIVVVDLIHDICQNDKDEIQAQTRAMRRLKLMAQKYLCIIFIIGQPRKVDSKNIGKPIDIYDSKGSESIVSESDVVYFMYREPVKNMTEDTMDRLSPEVQIRCMKARSKGKGSAFCKLFFLGKIATFREMVPVVEPVSDRLDF